MRSKTPTGLLQNADESVLHFTLSEVLLPESTLALHTDLGMLAHIAVVEGQARMLRAQQFTTGEMCLLVPLLESFPYHCPYEVLLASFNTGRTSEREVERARVQLQEAQEDGVWDAEMRPVRNILSRTRLKTRQLGIEISSILETGYIIMPILRKGQTVAIEETTLPH